MRTPIKQAADEIEYKNNRQSPILDSTDMAETIRLILSQEVPNPEGEYDWTQDELRAYQKAREDIGLED